MTETFIKIIHGVLVLSFVALSSTCCNGPSDSGGNKINPYIKEIKFSDPKLSPNFLMAVWRGNAIFAIQGLSKFTIDNQYNVVKDTLLETDIKWENWTYIDANEAGTKLLLIEYKYDSFYDIPTTTLYEYDFQSNRLQPLYDKKSNISTARYYPHDDTKIVYYSFGDSLSNGAGYYLRDKITQQDTLLFPYLSSAGIWETLHGFDIHPSGGLLLVPINRSSGRFTHEKSPKIGIASLKKQTLDTLDVNFDFILNRTGLYLRYNHDGSKILYCCFPDNAYGYVTNGTSEVGIIDATTLTKTILDVDTYGKGLGSIQLAPNWSPDETAIVYGSGEVRLDGTAGIRHLYILTKLN